MKSVMIVSLDQCELDSKLPRGDVQLDCKVVGLFWTPIRDGLVVLYEMDEDNILTFSNNRLDKHDIGDLSLLANRCFSLKLAHDERVYDVKWTGFTGDQSAIKGAVITNQKVYIVDEKLSSLSAIKMQDPITSIRWLGDHTVLATTSTHLWHVTAGNQASAVVSLREG